MWFVRSENINLKLNLVTSPEITSLGVPRAQLHLRIHPCNPTFSTKTRPRRHSYRPLEILSVGHNLSCRTLLKQFWFVPAQDPAQPPLQRAQLALAAPLMEWGRVCPPGLRPTDISQLWESPRVHTHTKNGGTNPGLHVPRHHSGHAAERSGTHPLLGSLGQRRDPGRK